MSTYLQFQLAFQRMDTKTCACLMIDPMARSLNGLTFLCFPVTELFFYFFLFARLSHMQGLF